MQLRPPCFRYVCVLRKRENSSVRDSVTFPEWKCQKVVRFRCKRSNGNVSKRHETANGNTGYPSCFRIGVTCFCDVSVHGFLEFRPVQMIKTQQLPQEEVERFTKESKALTTAVSVVGAVVLCFLPLALTVLSYAFELNLGLTNSFAAPWIRTFGMLNSPVNSILNPLIYCWRQKGMHEAICFFRTSSDVAPTAQNGALLTKEKTKFRNSLFCNQTLKEFIIKLTSGKILLS